MKHQSPSKFQSSHPMMTTKRPNMLQSLHHHHDPSQTPLSQVYQTHHAPPASAPHPHSDPSPSPIVAATSLLFANNNPQTLHSVSGPAGPILQHGLSAAPHSIQPRRCWPASALYSPVSPLPGRQTQKWEGDIPSSSSSPPASHTAPPAPAPPARAAAGCGC